MRNPNVRMLLIAVALVAAAALAGLCMAPRVASPAEGPALAYLRVQADAEVWPLIPLVDGGEYVVEQPDGRRNVIHTTATGAVMAFSTCHNQNCVQQGEVTLDNRDERVLGGMIVCLPNKVIVELLTPSEAGIEEANP